MNEKLAQTLRQIDTINSTDPNHESVNGKNVPKELLYSQRMTEKLLEFAPHASGLLQVAARGQHIRRWAIPRADYPMDRKGYLKWRTQLKLMHAELVGEIMQEAGYSSADIRYTQDLVMKKNLHKNADAQTLEDVICLVFIAHYLEDFARTKDEKKMIDILQKTWKKMSKTGHAAALALTIPSSVKKLIEKALSHA